MNDAIRTAAATADTNARITASELAGLCALLPADPLAVMLLAIARPMPPHAGMMVFAGHLRELVRKVDVLATPAPEPQPEPEKPAEGE